MKTILLSTICVFFLSTLSLRGQEIVKVIEINNRTGGATETLPFDRPVIVKYATKEQIVASSISLIAIPKKQVSLYYSQLFTARLANLFSGMSTGAYNPVPLEWQSAYNAGAADAKNELNIAVGVLDPNKFYDIVLLRRPTDSEADLFVDLFQALFDFYLGGGAPGTVNDVFLGKLNAVNQLKKPFQIVYLAGANIGKPDPTNLLVMYGSLSLSAQFTAMAALADAALKEKLRIKIREQIKTYVLPAGVTDFLIFPQSLSLSTTSLTFDTRTTFAITPDFGYVYYGGQTNFNGITPYLGVQIEFRYYDKNIPFRLIANRSFWHHLSFTTGLTLSSLKKESKRDDFFSGKSLLAGFGYRLSNAVRFTFGGIIFYREDSNPFIDNKKLGITPFAGISIDLKLKSLLTDFTGLVSTNRK